MVFHLTRERSEGSEGERYADSLWRRMRMWSRSIRVCGRAFEDGQLSLSRLPNRKRKRVLTDARHGSKRHDNHEGPHNIL